MGNEERKPEQVIDKARLTEPFFTGRTGSPILAHAEALFSVYRYEAIQDSVGDTVLQFADRNKENLGNIINRWNSLAERRIGGEISSTTLNALETAIADSYGPNFKAEAEYRRRQITEAAQIHRQERITLGFDRSRIR